MNLKGQGAIFLALATELVGLVLGCVYLGSLVDEAYQWKGFGVAGGAILALVSWIVHLSHMMKIMEKKQEDGTGDS